MRFVARLVRSPGVWFLLQAGVFLAGARLLAWMLSDASTLVSLAAWFAYLVAFGIVGMHLAHRVGVRDPSRRLRGAPDA